MSEKLNNRHNVSEQLRRTTERAHDLAREVGELVETEYFSNRERDQVRAVCETLIAQLYVGRAIADLIDVASAAMPEGE